MSSTYRNIHSHPSVITGIQTQANLNLRSPSPESNQSSSVHEKNLDASLKNCHHCACHRYHSEHGQTSELLLELHRCHNSNTRLRRRFFLPAGVIFVFLVLGGLFAWTRGCVNCMLVWGVDLMRRQALDDNPTPHLARDRSQLAPLMIITHDLLNPSPI
jgi:hypothetical protein